MFPNKNINKQWLWWLGLLALDLVSFVIFGGFLANWVAVIIVVLFAVVAWKNLAWAVVLLITELVVASQGYWFSITVGGTAVSLRLAIFLVIMAAFLAREVAARDFAWLKDKVVRWWLLAGLAIVWGAVWGWVNNDFADWFLDLNGYLYIFAFLPLYRYRHEWMPKLLSVWLPVVLYLSFKTIILFYLYSHFTPEALDPIYHWIRDTGWGEITYAGGNIFRIFSQSQIYLLIAAAFWAAGLLLYTDTKPLAYRFKAAHIGVALVVMAGLLISLSRSFWLGLVAGIVFAFVIGFWYKQTARQKLVNVCVLLVLLVASSGLVLAVSHFPLPKPLGDATGFLLERASVGTGEAAGASRLQLLGPLWQSVSKAWLLGSGFGSTVTYKTSDPRVVRGTAGASGIRTTYAFEWGYLDTWLKIGLIGLVLYLWWWLGLAYLAFKKIKRQPLAAAILVSVVAIAATNMTTPYLNHPLGIGALSVLLLFTHHEQIFEQPI
ncbi:TPA: hypothetical protein DIC39_02580 [Patescibacteria group bacterium]|nr:MAG: hypothetical protein UX54_C0008G0005 [Parcubacteria group bacterium GW2011_GWA2_46_39]HBV33232.1 hypothetical protein [Patescibacteria group bacterium]HCU47919.1 hypothetical protein [Patescibacteria group bacterium]